MALDGIFLHKLKTEIENTSLDARIEKIYQPTRDELVLILRKKGFGGKLFISARPCFGKMYFTDASFENPATPPMFCMLLRKHLTSAKFLGFDDTGFERIAVFNFEGVNEMGDKVTFKLAVELMGSKTNIILISADGNILDATRRVGIESNERLIQPGAKYLLPDKRNKFSITDDVANIVTAICLLHLPISKAVCEAIEGMSPLVAREITFASGLDNELFADDLNQEQKNALEQGIISVKADFAENKPVLLMKNGDGFDFTFIDVKQYGAPIEVAECDSFSKLLDAFYSSKQQAERLNQFSGDLIKLITTLIKRTIRKISIRKEELKQCENSEKMRIYGELIKANLHNIEKGMNSVTVENYYDDMKKIKIPLSVTLSPVENSQKYFKEYRKSCTALSTLGSLIKEGENELLYLESVLDSLQRANTVAEISEIKSELVDEGYLPRLLKQKQQNNKFKFEEHKSPSGFTVLVGKNNKQNEMLSLKTADKSDMWFHTKNIPGSHVVVLSGGAELREDDVIFAAKLAAKNSKAADSSNVPVDYTPVKQLKKPAGAKCGMVIYHTNKTIYVTPVT